jgi:hypothetical protein
MLLKTSAAAAGAAYRGPNPTQYPQMVAGDIPQEEIPPLEEDYMQEKEDPEAEDTDKEDSQEEED